MFLLFISSITLLVTITCFRVIKEAYGDYMAEKIAKQSSYLPPEDIRVDPIAVLVYTIGHLPTVFFMSVFTLLCTWSLTSLTCFHGLIISVAQTTNERVRNVYNDDRSYGSSGAANPADKGFVRNWKAALFAPIPESRLPADFSQTVDCLEGRRMRNLAIIASRQETFVDAEENYEDYDDDDNGHHDQEEDKVESIYDSRHAAQAVEASVEKGIVYSV